MKARYEALSLPRQHTFLIREFDEIGFSAPFHYHPEIELTLITSGQGERYVGSHMDRFESGDLILIGSNVPHCWKLNSDRLPGSCIVIQFTSDFMGSKFFDLPVMKQISKLFDQSRDGIRLKGRLRKHAETSMTHLVHQTNPFDMCIALLELLQQIATSRDWNLLTFRQRLNSTRRTDQDRILRVMDYIQQHFRGSISLGEVASVVHMTPQAFCKFFKRSTRRTMTEVVNGYRLDYATTLLTGTDLNISEIAYQSGFGDLSYFFKVFKINYKMTPSRYRKKYLQE